MIFAEFYYEGKQIEDKKVSSLAKVITLSYQQDILELFFYEEINVLYGKYINKFELHMYKVFSHTSASTTAQLINK